MREDILEYITRMPGNDLEVTVLTLMKLVDGLCIPPLGQGADGEPLPPDWATTAHTKFAPPRGGWLSSEKVAEKYNQLFRCICLEEWEQGLLFVVQLLSMIGGGL